MRAAVGHHHRDDVAADVVPALRVGRVPLERVHQLLAAEHVDPHRGVGLVGRARHRRRVGGLLQEPLDRPPVLGHRQHAEVLRVLPRHRDRGHGRARAVLQVLGDHLPRVHPVHVIGPEHDHQVRVLVVDQVHRLEDGVARPGVPVRPEPLLGRHRGHVVAEQVAHPPGGRDVPVQAVALVLGEHADLPDTAVGQVRQGEVDQPVHPAERHRGLGPVVRQRREPRAGPAGQHNSQDPRIGHVCSSRSDLVQCCPANAGHGKTRRVELRSNSIISNGPLTPPRQAPFPAYPAGPPAC